MMVEAGAREVTETTMIEALAFRARPHQNRLSRCKKELAASLGVPENAPRIRHR